MCPPKAPKQPTPPPPPPPPAPPAQAPEDAAPAADRATGDAGVVQSKRRGRGALRQDLAINTASAGSGVNLPS